MSISAPISVLVACEEDSMRASIASALGGDHDIVVLGEAKDGVEAINKVRALPPDVVVMDIATARVDGALALDQIINADSRSKVLVFALEDREEDIRTCMIAGASGYLMQESLLNDLSKAIRVAHGGGHFFSPDIARRIVRLYLKQVVSAVP